MIGRRIAALREDRALPRLRLAREAGVSHTSLVLLEGGRTEPRLETLARVAKSLGCRVADLLADEPRPPSPRAGTTSFYRLVARLRERQDDPHFLRTVEQVVLGLERAFDAAVK
jgi:transcriptional regulator with XRE-family HTH domain